MFEGQYTELDARPTLRSRSPHVPQPDRGRPGSQDTSHRIFPRGELLTARGAMVSAAWRGSRARSSNASVNGWNFGQHAPRVERLRKSAVDGGVKAAKGPAYAPLRSPAQPRPLRTCRHSLEPGPARPMRRRAVAATDRSSERPRWRPTSRDPLGHRKENRHQFGVVGKRAGGWLGPHRRRMLEVVQALHRISPFVTGRSLHCGDRWPRSAPVQALRPPRLSVRIQRPPLPWNS